MKRTQITALVLILVALGAVVAIKVNKPKPADVPTVPATPAVPAALPKLVDLGSTTCIPCKELAPILDELKTELQGKVEIQFIDVTKDPKAADTYAINVIPTQIFLDAQGRELSRHEGFIPKADILTKLHELKMLPQESGR